MSALQRPGFNLIFGEAYADERQQERMIKASSLDWTIARPGVPEPFDLTEEQVDPNVAYFLPIWSSGGPKLFE